MAQIREILQDMNPWWKGEFNVEFNERELHKTIQKYLPLKQIVAFTGLRRVGKTTLMLKIIEDEVRGGLNSHNILFFSFDEFKDIEIDNLIKVYEEILEKDIRKGKYLLLFDEIQKLNDWENKIKRIYDTFRNIKIIISGSESLFIKNKSRAILAGRIFEFKVETLTFKEFLDFKDFNHKPLNLYNKDLKKLFNEFIFTLGFPELVGIKEKEIIKKYIKESILEKVIYNDIPKLFKIKDVSILESLFNIFLEEPGQIVEISKLANELNISRQSLSLYLRYLEDSFLIRKLYNYSRNKRKIERKLKKYYPTMLSPDLLFKDDILSKSKTFEWLIINQLKAEFFWRDPYKNEVDIIKDNIPIEIKYGKIDLNGILLFMDKFKVNNGYVISLNEEEEKTFKNKKVKIIPAFKFLISNHI
ncbi:ATP-binding protein [Candidatus Woesearchaeota archaeon]|nr:ATP-binding protein [Candidatus Woesearchaeota archaeon]